MFYTYILQSEVDNSLYTGYTALEPLARLKKHNTGEVVYTSKKKPWN